MATNDVTQLVVQGSVLGQQHIHTLNFRHATAGATEQGLIDSWQGNCLGLYRALFSTADSPVQILRAIQVCGTPPMRATVEETSPAGSILGTRTTSTEPMPPWLASVVSVRSAFAGRSYRGRFFVGGIYEGDQSGGNLVAGYLTLLENYVFELTDSYGPAGASPDFKLVVWSPKLKSVAGATCLSSSSQVVGFLVRSVLGSMKSRRPGNGS